ncbi:MAG: PhoPQ-activated pathogenicity-related family protein [Treponema sp.]|nr:PhoPQ-activated pathogenicity-related family protein [Treponema sp.]
MEEILNFYQNNIYGQWRSGEEVSYEIKDIKAGTKLSLSIPWIKLPGEYESLARKSLKIKVSNQGKEVSFSVEVYLPCEECKSPVKGGFPFITAFHPIEAISLALKKGFALIVFTDYCSKIALDNNERKGIFYDLYPYGADEKSQTGVLMAWSWAASKVLDAIYGGAAEELGLNTEDSIITGVSRWGKTTALCGAFEKRFKMVVPACSGAGGLALFGYKSEGKTYDFSNHGGPKAYTYGQNEPLGALQSKEEGGWFNNHFLQYKNESEIQMNQENLIKACASKNRYYFVIASCINEDWVNGPAMWEACKRASEYFKEKGLENHLAANIHLTGHAVIEEDMEKLTNYFTLMENNQSIPEEISKLSDFTRQEFKQVK